MSNQLYEVWYVPTEKGKNAFGWQEKKALCKALPLEKALFECYLLSMDDLAPDASQYRKYEVRPVKPKQIL